MHYLLDCSIQKVCINLVDVKPAPTAIEEARQKSFTKWQRQEMVQRFS